MSSLSFRREILTFLYSHSIQSNYLIKLIICRKLQMRFYILNILWCTDEYCILCIQYSCFLMLIHFLFVTRYISFKEFVYLSGNTFTHTGSFWNYSFLCTSSILRIYEISLKMFFSCLVWIYSLVHVIVQYIQFIYRYTTYIVYRYWAVVFS